jgi:hypothetical protein
VVFFSASATYITISKTFLLLPSSKLTILTIAFTDSSVVRGGPAIPIASAYACPFAVWTHLHGISMAPEEL